VHTPTELKVTPRHLARNAYLYVRQSTLRQVCFRSSIASARDCTASAGWRRCTRTVGVIECPFGYHRARLWEPSRVHSWGRAGLPVRGAFVSRVITLLP
jgi:hypothetical protein